MTTSPNQLLTAIEYDELTTKVVNDEKTKAIAILVGDCEVARIGCLQMERPLARVSHDGRSVEVFPSPGLPDGFSIACKGHEDAIIIAETLDKMFEVAYTQLMEHQT
ncbi:hypothetical protein [Schlesneria paludicola]|uniref:hypothetical protein n=1 Tax=Schlesneria paludicola TaxID=360056 RepID=UPI0012FA7DC8|nr:hypothetical protein [Schlesneria paludicola]